MQIQSDSMRVKYKHLYYSFDSVSCDSIVVSTLHCGCKNPGSNPGHSIFGYISFPHHIYGIHRAVLDL